jgi:hypothetical protein
VPCRRGCAGSTRFCELVGIEVPTLRAAARHESKRAYPDWSVVDEELVDASGVPL